MNQKIGLVKSQHSNIKNNKKIIDDNSKIAEILGLLEELGKGKDWILQEIKKNKFNTSIKSTMNSFEILKCCPSGFISHLLRVLKNDNFENFPDIKTLTKTYHWF